MDTASGFAKDPVGIPTQEVVDFTGLQSQAFDRTQQGLGTFQPYLDRATTELLGSTAAYDPMSYQQYMNPYQDEVIAGIEQQFQKMQNQADAQAVSTGAFGGARQGVQTAELGRQQAQASQGLGALGAQQQALQQGDIASAMSAGSVQQQRQQQIQDAQYRQKIQQLYEPFQRLGFVRVIYQGMPSSGMATTMGTSPTVNPLAQAVGTGIQGLAAYEALKSQGLMVSAILRPLFQRAARGFNTPQGRMFTLGTGPLMVDSITDAGNITPEDFQDDVTADISTEIDVTAKDPTPKGPVDTGGPTIDKQVESTIEEQKNEQANTSTQGAGVETDNFQSNDTQNDSAIASYIDNDSVQRINNYKDTIKQFIGDSSGDKLQKVALLMQIGSSLMSGRTDQPGLRGFFDVIGQTGRQTAPLLFD